MKEGDTNHSGRLSSGTMPLSGVIRDPQVIQHFEEPNLCKRYMPFISRNHLGDNS